MFMPQKPYMILGSLRDQIQYPRAIEVSDDRLLEILGGVGLAHLPEQFGGLDAELHWADVLSGGEQQRLAFARLLLNGPRFAFLDEATSALDMAAEQSLYARLAQSPTAFISIGHRQSLRQFHQRVIELPGGFESALAPDGRMANSSSS